MHAAAKSVPEVPHGGEDHCQTGIVGGLDHIVVADRAARLDHRGRSGFGGGEQAVGEGEKGIAGHCRSGCTALRPAELLCRFGRLHGGDPRAVAAVHLARADPGGDPVLGIDDRVALYVARHGPGEQAVLQFLLGGLDKVPVLPVFINGVATPLPGFQRTRMLGEAIGRFTSTLNKRVLFLGSGGLSHQPPVPELAKADAHMRDRLLGSGKDLPASERELRQQRVISAAEKFVEDQRTLHPLNPIWDNQFMTLLEQGRIQELDAVSNEELSAIAGKSTHEIKTWVAAFAAISAFGNWRSEGRYYRPIPEWIAGFGSLSARTEN